MNAHCGQAGESVPGGSVCTGRVSFRKAEFRVRDFLDRWSVDDDLWITQIAWCVAPSERRKIPIR